MPMQDCCLLVSHWFLTPSNNISQLEDSSKYCLLTIKWCYRSFTVQLTGSREYFSVVLFLSPSQCASDPPKAVFYSFFCLSHIPTAVAVTMKNRILSNSSDDTTQLSLLSRPLHTQAWSWMNLLPNAVTISWNLVPVKPKGLSLIYVRFLHQILQLSSIMRRWTLLTYFLCLDTIFSRHFHMLS